MFSKTTLTPVRSTAVNKVDYNIAKSNRCNSTWLSLIILIALWPTSGQAADAGTSVGIFLNPTPACPPAICSGIGTNSISWGLGSQGNLTFVGDSFSPSPGDTFRLGTLTYRNGSTILQGADLTGIGLDIPLQFGDTSKNFTYHASLSINNTPNIGTPEASADFVSFFGSTFPYTFNVLEGATASVDLKAKLTPTEGQLQLISLENPTTGGFVAIVPEPSIYAMLLADLSFVGLVASRRGRPTWRITSQDVQMRRRGLSERGAGGRLAIL